MIESFADKRTARIFAGIHVRDVAPELARAARRKLLRLDRARSLDDLRVPPGNRLEALKGERAGQWSIRVNEQWRICFRWQGADAFEVWFGDYH